MRKKSQLLKSWSGVQYLLKLTYAYCNKQVVFMSGNESKMGWNDQKMVHIIRNGSKSKIMRNGVKITAEMGPYYMAQKWMIRNLGQIWNMTISYGSSNQKWVRAGSELGPNHQKWRIEIDPIIRNACGSKMIRTVSKWMKLNEKVNTS